MDTEEKNEFENELLSRISQMERGNEPAIQTDDRNGLYTGGGDCLGMSGSGSGRLFSGIAGGP